MRSTKTLRFFSRKNAFERILGRKDRSNEIYRAHITRLQDVENLILARRGSRRVMLRGLSCPEDKCLRCMKFRNTSGDY